MSSRELPGDARYVVVAPLVMVWKATGGVVMLRKGAMVPASIDPTQRDHLLVGEMIRLRDTAEPEPTPAPHDSP
ncbi:MAG: hypothetical protein OSB43_18140 [Nocardioides sp.]|uniref:hypothetical protein n=1 Tax=Nocardioides sp. TaxID=35761 RepID=UPI00239CB004|nr:hypothetical protein [Nocardioides sp.]MDE0778205.1 hypothetical protein [Nocardioides sp.]